MHSSSHLRVVVPALACAAVVVAARRANAQGMPDPRYPADPYGPPPVAGVDTSPLQTRGQEPENQAAPVTTTGAVVAGPIAGETREEAYVPNAYLLTTGFILWGGSYAGSVIVAAQSSNAADQKLYVPIVGPWVDLANRPACPSGNAGCGNETANKVLLGVDGALQGIGTLAVLWGFLSPEHREITTVAATRYTPAIHFEPATVASGYGLAALASF